MPRQRKSELLPAISSFADQFSRLLTEAMRQAIQEGSQDLHSEIQALRRDLIRLERTGLLAGSRSRQGEIKLCSAPDCGQPHVARGLCKNHYQQQRYAARKRAQGLTVRPRAANRRRYLQNGQK